MGEYVRPNVTPIHHDGTVRCHRTLELDHLFPYRAEGSDTRDDMCDLRRSDLMRHIRPINGDACPALCAGEPYIDVMDSLQDVRIGRFLRLLQCFPCHTAIHRARVNVGIAELFCHNFGNGTFSGACRSINCYDTLHTKSSSFTAARSRKKMSDRKYSRFRDSQ